MNQYAIVLIYILFISFHKDTNQYDITTPVKTKTNLSCENLDYGILSPKKESYEVKFSLEKLNDNSYNIVVKMFLHNNSYYVSPYSRRDFKGKFKLNITPNNNLTIDNFLIESPQSQEEYDSHPFVNGLVNWVRVNTSYKKQLFINTKENFITNGFIQFTIEPKCTLEKIPFMITQKNGNLSIELGGC